MSNAVTVAKVFVLLLTDLKIIEECESSIEPYRCLMDMTRDMGIHSIVDGSDDYHDVLDALEVLNTLNVAV